jgi:hypothetical protein
MVVGLILLTTGDGGVTTGSASVENRKVFEVAHPPVPDNPEQAVTSQL